MKILTCAFLLLFSAQSTQEPIRVVIGKGKSLTVTIPNIEKEDLRDILSTFFSRGDEQAEKKFKSLFKESQSLTVILTTER